jgi:hypothetical protein
MIQLCDGTMNEIKDSLVLGNSHFEKKKILNFNFSKLKKNSTS